MVTGEPVVIDGSVAYPARVYDYLLSGTDNFAVDRNVAEHVFATYPGGVDSARADALADRAFLGRAARYLVIEAGIRQFLDIGTGIPRADNVHQITQAIAPESRIVSVDNDPLVLAHAHSLRASTPEGATAYIDGDLHNPYLILRHAGATLDFTQPVAVILTGILHFIPEDKDPYGIVARLVDATCSGSYLAISHLASDIRPDEMAKMAQLATERMSTPMVLRSHADVTRFLTGLEIVDPGVVQATQWQPDAVDHDSDQDAVVHCALGRKP